MKSTTVNYLRCYERRYPKIMSYLRLINNSGIDIKEIMSIETSQLVNNALKTTIYKRGKL